MNSELFVDWLKHFAAHIIILHIALQLFHYHHTSVTRFSLLINVCLVGPLNVAYTQEVDK
ncbi:hypothetical protein PR048_006438 [Dryococelus australis]|uniref:Uncharacterized protein n=1 Tax=Dryococelus australis TaxID=614101 RepID=A0ABQ9IB04_9NEOP|nr:hypothetical protein PR048_006438 [Dryococelus australis]